MFPELIPELSALAQVLMVDIVLAGDNAIVVGVAAARVEPEQRAKIIFWGTAAAVVLRVFFSLITVQLLSVIGLTLAGGLLLLWVCWKLFRETHSAHRNHKTAIKSDNDNVTQPGKSTGKSMRAAICQILIADVSMSLDNVLAVAGAAHGHMIALIIGLVMSVALMGAAASVIAPLFKRWPWIAYVGLTIILYVSLDMIWAGSHEVLFHLRGW